jgi:hypothetical protein
MRSLLRPVSAAVRAVAGRSWLEQSSMRPGLDFLAEDRLVTYDMEMTYGPPSGQMAFLDVVEEALL